MPVLVFKIKNPTARFNNRRPKANSFPPPVFLLVVAFRQNTRKSSSLKFLRKRAKLYNRGLDSTQSARDTHGTRQTPFFDGVVHSSRAERTSNRANGLFCTIAAIVTFVRKSVIL